MTPKQQTKAVSLLIQGLKIKDQFQEGHGVDVCLQCPRCGDAKQLKSSKG